jgi:arylsulfatase A-like enzyme
MPGQKKPNILIIWGDDIGWFDVSMNNNGIMGIERRTSIGSRRKAATSPTGPLTIKPMETVDEEFLDASLKFIEKANADGKPFFVWWNSTRMHVFTHLKKKSDGKTGLGLYPDGMVEHDGHVGKLLDKIDQLGIADNTIVMYSTDNGAECLSWPDGGWTPFRGEKDTNWEGGWRAPCCIRWPGVIEPGTVSITSSPIPTCCRRCLPPLASPTSSRN